MARQCGVCKLPPREGQEMGPVRVYPEDVEGVQPPVEPGLYHVCLECRERFRPLVAERLGKEPDALGQNDFC